MNPENYYEALPLPAISIGLKVWVYDINRRVYREPARLGQCSGSPIVREHYRPGEIVGETRQSWLVRAEGREMKIPKKARARGSPIRRRSWRVGCSRKNTRGASRSA